MSLSRIDIFRPSRMCLTNIARRWIHHLPRCAQTLLNLPETRISTLGNGLKVATEQTDSCTSTIGIWLDAGSRYETEKTSGVANLLQRLAFMGSRQRNRQEMHCEIQKLGAQISGYTEREETAYYAKCLPGDVPDLVALLGNMLLDPRLEDIEEARVSILNELVEIENDPRQVTFNYLHLTAYQGTPLSWSVYGSTENVEKLKKEDVAFYHRNNVIAPRMVLCGTGAVDHDQLVQLADKYFSSVPSTYTGEIPVMSPWRFTGSEVRARDDWLPFAHVAVAVDTCGMNNPDIYPLMLAQTHMGCWDKTYASSSNTRNSLVQNIYRASGCHGYESFHILYQGSGLWGCYFVMDGMLLDDFMYNLQDEWMKLCVSITYADLLIAKNMFRFNLIQKLDDSVNTCTDMARQILASGDRLYISEIDKMINRVTLKDFRDTCAKYIYDRCPAVSAVGPVEAMTDYNRVRSNMYWLRY